LKLFYEAVPDGRQNVNVDVSKIPVSQVKAPLPTTDDPEVVIGGWTWQTESGIIDAIGGTGKSGDYPNSCLAQAGIKNTRFIVMNDTSEQVKAIATGAMQIGTTTGDQSAVDLAGLNNLLKRNGAKAFFSAGYSSGEDGFFGPESLKLDPQTAKGIVVVTAIPYCDWNVIVNWAYDNNIPVNPDESTYDETAINIVNAVDHLESAQKYIQNAKVSLRNKKTGISEEHEIVGLGTWTPGDVMAVEGRPTVTYRGKSQKLVRVISTKEYSYMMPNILFADEKFIREHKSYLETLTTCVLRSNDKIKNDPNYFANRVAVLNAVVFNVAGKGASFWNTYFKGAKLNGVDLGGSRVNSLSEVRHLFGMDQGISLENSVFGISYNDHAKNVQKLMPDRLPKITPVREVVDLSIIESITASGEKTESKSYQASFESSNQGSTFVSSNYQINFDNGSSIVKLTPENQKVLQEIYNVLIRAGDTKVLIEGHTDNVGDEVRNLMLSKERARAVWLVLKSMDKSGIITESRLRNIEGYGSYRPVADNNTVQGKSLNRRVTLVLN
jgi:OmpA-OmpF porin, OOP family